MAYVVSGRILAVVTEGRVLALSRYHKTTVIGHLPLNEQINNIFLFKPLIVESRWIVLRLLGQLLLLNPIAVSHELRFLTNLAKGFFFLLVVISCLGDCII